MSSGKVDTEQVLWACGVCTSRDRIVGCSAGNYVHVRAFKEEFI